MRLLLSRGLFLLLLALWQLPSGSQPLKAFAYQAWWLPESWRSAPLAQLDRLFFFELKVDVTGAIVERHGWPEEWVELQKSAQKNNLPIDLTLTLFDVGVFNTLFSSDDAVRHFELNCLELATSSSVSGLQFDFEIYSGANAVAIGSYRQALRRLSEKLKQLQPARHLSVFVPVKSESPLYDAETLKLMNDVVLQSYDTHYKSSPNAGPIAPLQGSDALTWKSAVVDGLALGVRSEQLVLTFPFYGYEWPVTDAKLRSKTLKAGNISTFAALTQEQMPDIRISVKERVAQYGAQHDPSTGSSFYKFKNDQGPWVEAWFEDWWSLGRKFDLLTQEKLGGVAFFVLGYDKNELLDYYLQRRGPKNLDALFKQFQ
jgi:spore germination protein YaaH